MHACMYVSILCHLHTLQQLIRKRSSHPTYLFTYIHTYIHTYIQVEVDIIDQLEEYQRVQEENQTKASHWLKELEKVRKLHTGE